MIPFVLGGLTRDYTGTSCVGDVVSLTCTLSVSVIDGALLEWDVPDATREIRLSSTTPLPILRDQYTVISAIFDSTSSMIYLQIAFPCSTGYHYWLLSCVTGRVKGRTHYNDSK